VLAYNRYVVNNCTWRGRPRPPQRAGMQILVDGGGAAVSLWPYQLARRCLTRGTVRSDVAAASAVLWRSRTPAKWWGTCEQCMGVLLWCVVKRFRSRSTCVCMVSASTASRLTGQVATTYAITITRPHLIALSSPCTYLCLLGSATRLL